MTKQKVFLIVLILASTCSRCAAAGPKAWEKLNLKRATIAGATVYYESCFEPNLPFFEKAYKRLLAATEKKPKPLPNQAQIIAKINHILGIAEPNIVAQKQMLNDLTRPLPFPKLSFYLVREDTTKNFLRAGGKLPNFKYDPVTDEATYYLPLQWTLETASAGACEFAFPLSSEAEFEKMVGGVLDALSKLMAGGAKTASRIGLAIHEVVEIGLVERVRPQGPYWRWFSDGFANAVAVEILKNHVSENAAEEYARAIDVNDRKALEKEINLQYWMAAKYCVSPLHSPIAYESRLTDARYASAMFEAQRIIERHGIECVRKILDELCDKESRTGQDIIQAIEKVTGEDMEARLGRYQTFLTRKEGLAKYEVPFKTASKEQDYEQMLINLLRLMELQESQFSPENLEYWTSAALLLAKLGHEDAGDQAMQTCIELFRGSPFAQGHDAAIEMFIVYCLNSGKPQKALNIAKEQLKTRPEHVLSLTVFMLVDAESGKLAKAQETAKKILRLAKSKEAASYKAASRILAMEPNQPQQDK